MRELRNLILKTLDRSGGANTLSRLLSIISSYHQYSSYNVVSELGAMHEIGQVVVYVANGEIRVGAIK